MRVYLPRISDKAKALTSQPRLSFPYSGTGKTVTRKVRQVTRARTRPQMAALQRGPQAQASRKEYPSDEGSGFPLQVSLSERQLTPRDKAFVSE